MITYHFKPRKVRRHRNNLFRNEHDIQYEALNEIIKIHQQSHIFIYDRLIYLRTFRPELYHQIDIMVSNIYRSRISTIEKSRY